MFTIDATNLPRLMQCNGSRLLPPAFPDAGEGDTTLRDEGNAAHYMAHAAFRNEFTVDELIDRKAPNGVYMSIEMAEHVQEYLDAIVHLDRGDITNYMEIETSFGNDNWRVNARADHIAIAANVLYVDDFKYGWSIVEPRMNWTLLAHAIGFVQSRNITPVRIVLTIHQPRPYHRDGKSRSWSIDFAELVTLYERITAVMSNPSDELNTGPACRRCHALATCPAARQAELNAIDVVEHIAFNDEIPDDALSFELDTLQRATAMMKQRFEALQELAKHRIKGGKIVPNYALERQLANTSWKPGIDGMLLMALTGKKLTVEKLLTFAQAKKIVPEEIIKPFTERLETGMKLTRVDANEKASRIFGEKEK